MTRSVIELAVTDEDRRVAWLATAAVGLSLVDAAIPSPLPGVSRRLVWCVRSTSLACFARRTMHGGAGVGAGVSN